MKILAHRGLWREPSEKNSLGALVSALEAGCGIETDVRDCAGQLVVSHDPPSSDTALSLDSFLEEYSSRFNSCLALNIKSDGLHQAVLEQINKHKISNYFVFDMSVPDLLGYRRLSMPFAVRLSEYERDEGLLADASYVWLDSFHEIWFTVEAVQRLLSLGKAVAIVSPELHGRKHLNLWQALLPVSSSARMHLCTDFVQEAMEFFNVKQN